MLNVLILDGEPAPVRVRRAREILEDRGCETMVVSGDPEAWLADLAPLIARWQDCDLAVLCGVPEPVRAALRASGARPTIELSSSAEAWYAAIAV